jgi:lipooligosaccharide transport system permease protein
MLATPLGIGDVALGHLAWMTVRVAITCVIFTVVMVLFGVAHSAGVVLAVPAAVLTGAAFVGPIAAYTASLKGDGGLSGIMRFGIVPMFLFSGTFFPVRELPAAFEPVAVVTPRWHGVELCRSLSLGTARLGPSLAHVGYLLLWTIAGAALAVHRFRRRLVE